MAKKLVLRLILAPLDRIWHAKFYSWILPLLHVIHHWKLSLYAISRKTNDPNLRKWKKKTSFRTNFGPFVPNLGPKILFHRFYLQCMLDIVASYHKLEKMVKNLVSKPILAPLAQIQDQNFFFINFTSTACQTLLQAITVGNFKEN